MSTRAKQIRSLLQSYANHVRYCSDVEMREEMRFGRRVNSGDLGTDDTLRGVIMSSAVPAGLAVPETAVLEYTSVKSQSVEIGENTILNGYT